MVSCSIVHTVMLGKVAYDENNCKKESAHTLVVGLPGTVWRVLNLTVFGLD